MDDENVDEFIFKAYPRDENLGDDYEFDESQLEEFKIAFQKIDKSSAGYVVLSEIGNLLRAAGLNPSMKEVYDMMQWMTERNISRITYEEFIHLLTRLWTDVNHTNVLRDAFEAIDTVGNGYFTVDQLKQILLGTGEQLDEQDFKELCKSVTVQADETINYEDIIKLLGNVVRPS